MDRLVVVNPSFIDKLAQYGIERDRVSYIPNFVSKEGFSEGTEEERIAFRQRFNIPEQGVCRVRCRANPNTEKAYWIFWMSPNALNIYISFGQAVFRLGS